METYTTNEILFSVFVTNGDAALVEYDEQAEEVKAWLDNATIEEVTDKEEFDNACAILDFSEQVPPRAIHRVTSENPNECGYICFSNNYGD